MGEALSYDARAAVDRGLELARRTYALVDPSGDDGLGNVRIAIHGGSNSWFNRLTRRVSIGVGGAKPNAADARLDTIETTIHELSHKWFDARARHVGLLYAGPSGRLSEGTAQVMAGAALVLSGDAQEQAWGWKVLDPRGQAAPFTRMFGETLQVPLSLTMDDVRAAGVSFVDNGYVHVHSGVIQAAHFDMATELGAETMARITTTAAREGLTPVTGFRAWAQETTAAAARLYGAGSGEAAAVRRAWQAAKVVLPG